MAQRLPTLTISDEHADAVRAWVAGHLDYPTVAYRMDLLTALTLVEANHPGGVAGFILAHAADPQS